MVNVSVIMPVYNSERYIAEALDSVLAQSYRDFEVIVVDDGSIDRCGAIAQTYEKRYAPQVRYIYQENTGPGGARNTGIRHATGNYIAFIDADDIWQQDKLKRQVEYLRRNHDTGLVYCDNLFIDVEGRPLSGYERKIELYSGRITARLYEHYFIMPSAVLMRKECFESAGVFREDICVGEDYDLFLRIAYEYRIGLVREKLYARRHVHSSLSNHDWLVNARNDIAILAGFAAQHPQFYAEHKALVKERLGQYHFAAGYYGLKHGRNAKALRYFLASLRFRRNAKTLKCMLLCAVPYRLVQRWRTGLRNTRWEHRWEE